jgi:predicted Zn-dependent peptidase
VLEQVLDDQLSSLRSKQAVTYGFYASYEAREAGGMWRIGGDADASRAAEAGSAIAQILADMRKDPESYRASFVLARQKVLESLLVTATDSNAIANRLVEMARFNLADDYYDTLVHKVAQLKLADFQVFVKGELTLDHEVFGAFGNKAAVDQVLGAAQKVQR